MGDRDDAGLIKSRVGADITLPARDGGNDVDQHTNSSSSSSNSSSSGTRTRTRTGSDGSDVFEVFDAIDRNGDGEITVIELIAALRSRDGAIASRLRLPGEVHQEDGTRGE